MNLCFLLGKVVSNIEYQFIYDNKEISIVLFDLLLENKSIIFCKAYNEKADWIYQRIEQNNMICIQGRVHSQWVEIEEVKHLK